MTKLSWPYFVKGKSKNSGNPLKSFNNIDIPSYAIVKTIVLGLV